MCRQFVELAFERVGMPIRWQGPEGVDERGIVAGGSQAGRTVVTISPHFYRPEEVTNELLKIPSAMAGYTLHVTSIAW